MLDRKTLGRKHSCECGCKFYDMGKSEVVCPKCGAVLEVEEELEDADLHLGFSESMEDVQDVELVEDEEEEDVKIVSLSEVEKEEEEPDEFS